jgi:HemY protein
MPGAYFGEAAPLAETANHSGADAPAEFPPAPAAAGEIASPSPQGQSAEKAAIPLFRQRPDDPKAAARNVPPVIPILRAPDDPGIDEEAPSDEFAEQIAPAKAQKGGWRGFLSRWFS